MVAGVACSVPASRPDLGADDVTDRLSEATWGLAIHLPGARRLLGPGLLALLPTLDVTLGVVAIARLLLDALALRLRLRRRLREAEIGRVGRGRRGDGDAEHEPQRAPRPQDDLLRRGAGGTLTPALRASESPIAIACSRLVTFLPE